MSIVLKHLETNDIDFSNYKTFAYFRPEIDKVDISDLDKRRILRALDKEMNLKGLSKSETPDLLIGFTTKAKDKIYVTNYQDMSSYGALMMGLLGMNIKKNLKEIKNLQQKYFTYTPLKDKEANRSYENWKLVLKKFYL